MLRRCGCAPTSKFAKPCVTGASSVCALALDRTAAIRTTTTARILLVFFIALLLKRRRRCRALERVGQSEDRLSDRGKNLEILAWTLYSQSRSTRSSAHLSAVIPRKQPREQRVRFSSGSRTE